MTVYDYYAPTKIIVGPGSITKIVQETHAFSAKRILIVTDQDIVKVGLLEPLQQSLMRAGLETAVYDRVKPNPTVAIIDAGRDFYREHRCDIVVSIGGGSSIDTAKGIAVTVAGGGSIRDYAGQDKVRVPPVPHIAVPTTAGTGSEVSKYCSVTDEEHHFKLSVASRRIIPQVGVLDPELVRSLPAHIAAETGMDTLTHLIEGYVCRQFASVLTDFNALEGIKLIGSSLVPFVADRSNLESAQKMQLAAMFGGIVISNSRTGPVHAMARPVGAHFGISHGLANAILLPHVMDFNCHASPERFMNIALALGAPIPVCDMALSAAAQASVEAVRGLCRQTGIPERLRDVGVGTEAIEQMSKDAAAISLKRKEYYPRMIEYDDFVVLFNKAI